MSSEFVSSELNFYPIKCGKNRPSNLINLWQAVDFFLQQTGFNLPPIFRGNVNAIKGDFFRPLVCEQKAESSDNGYRSTGPIQVGEKRSTSPEEQFCLG
jgi:hypothetical protein